MEIAEILRQLNFDADTFPEEAMSEAVRQREAITPVLLDVLDDTFERAEELVKQESYGLHLYAMFLLAQFREKRAFPKVIRLLTLDAELLDDLMGESVTEDFSRFLLSTYDGSFDLLKDIAGRGGLDPFARCAPIWTMEALYFDGVIDRTALVCTLRRLASGITDEEGEDIVGAAITLVVSEGHLDELIEDVRRLFLAGRVDTMFRGEFDDFLDAMFDYDHNPERTLVIEDAAAVMRGWACFEKPLTEAEEREQRRKRKQELQKLVERHSDKVGRNDPCPCGSGKKYKKCCLNRTPQEKHEMLLMKEYPSLEAVPQGRLSFAEHYAEAAIAIDIPAYKALHHVVPRAARVGQQDQLLYLEESYRLFCELCEREGIRSLEEFDQKYAVHYTCLEWLEKLAELLENTGDLKRHDQVLATIRQMTKA